MSNSNKKKKKNPRALLVDSILCPILAGLLMHGPGLRVKLTYENMYQYLESLTGAAVEGVFLLMLASRVWSVGRHVHGQILLDWKDSSKLVGFIAIKLYQGCGVLLSIWYFGFILTSVCGDATFRLMSGNDSPSGEELRSGAGCGISCAIAPFRNEPLVAAWRLVLEII